MRTEIGRRIVSLWFPRLASDRVSRVRAVDGPLALTLRQGNANRVYCLNEQAERHGLHRGMSHADARAFCPELQSCEATPETDRRFQLALRRWVTCPPKLPSL